MATIAQEIMAIAEANGYAGGGSPSIAEAIDILSTTLAGEDTPKSGTIANAVSELGKHVSGGGGGGGVEYNAVNSCYAAFVDSAYRDSAPTFSQISGIIPTSKSYGPSIIGPSKDHEVARTQIWAPSSTDNGKIYVAAGTELLVSIVPGYTADGASLWKSDGMGGFVKYADYGTDSFLTTTYSDGGTPREHTYTVVPDEKHGNSGPSFYLIYMRTN